MAELCALFDFSINALLPSRPRCLYLNFAGKGSNSRAFVSCSRNGGLPLQLENDELRASQFLSRSVGLSQASTLPSVVFADRLSFAIQRPELRAGLQFRPSWRCDSETTLFSFRH